MMHVKISAGDITLTAELNDTQTARKIWEALPLQAVGNLWGDEIYFSIPVDAGEENPQEVVERGDLGYWEPGSALCIFYGPTPASRGDEVRPASPVTVFGNITGDCTVLKKVKGSPKVRIERSE